MRQWYVVIVIELLLVMLMGCSVGSGSGGDLNSDKEALLSFSASILHRPKLNWNASSSMCISWVGITCTPFPPTSYTRVTAVRLPGIGLLGPILPNTIGNLDALRVLSLRSNRLSSPLPPDVASLPSLHSLFLQHNNFSGPIPSSFSPQLNVLDLSFNSFTGAIPKPILNLTRLTTLSLQVNNLSGAIPSLSLPRLKHLNLSYNNFSGSIPSSLRNFPNSSFLGNPFLCGSPLDACSPVLSPPPPPPKIPQRHHTEKNLATGVIIAIIAGGAAVLVFLCVVLLFCFFRRKDRGSSSVLKGKGSSAGRGEKPREEFGSGVQEPDRNKLVFFEGCSYNFDLEDLLRASAEVLGKGSYGTAYKAILEEATTLVVKRLKEVVVENGDFEQQMDLVDLDVYVCNSLILMCVKNRCIECME